MQERCLKDEPGPQDTLQDHGDHSDQTPSIGHGVGSTQVVSSLGSPLHCLPLSRGSGLSQNRKRTLVPLSHDELHNDQAVHSLQPPSIARTLMRVAW